MRSIQQTSSRGGKTLGAIASIPAGLKLFEGFNQLRNGEYTKAQSTFEECAGIPGIVPIIENAVNFTKGESIKEHEIQEGRNSLINTVSVGLPSTIDLFVDLGYE